MTEGQPERRLYDERMATFIERLTRVEGQLDRVDTKYVRAPGKDEAVVTDANILAAVTAIVAPAPQAG